MSQIIDETGNIYGKLTVIGFAGLSKRGQALWNCICECGRSTKSYGSSLRRGGAKTCGKCDKIERIRNLNKTHGMANKCSLYRVWRAMKNRCYDPNNKAYKHYGARGISISDEWKNNFVAFYNWAVKNGYHEGLTIERNNPDVGYFPENCSWIPMSEQNKNKRNTVYLTWNGETKSMLEWAKDERVISKNITYRILKRRKGLGWCVEKIFTTPVIDRKFYLTYNGKTKSLMEWSKEAAVKYRILQYRIRKLNWDVEKALTTPIKGK